MSHDFLISCLDAQYHSRLRPGSLTFRSIPTLSNCTVNKMRLGPVPILLLVTAGSRSSTAFVVVMPHRARNTQVCYSQHLSEIDEMCIENAAAWCLEPSSKSMECDLEEFEALVNTLQEARDYHTERVETINLLLSKLRGIEGKSSAKELTTADESTV
jgi:hypothetical protein